MVEKGFDLVTLSSDFRLMLASASAILSDVNLGGRG
jgi:hypothetical protein